jgi:glycosyltransferase involved in cell wall biosynthesis
MPGHRGGVDRVIEAVAPRLAQLGHEVVVYCATWSPSRPSSYEGVELRYVYSPRRKYLDTFVRSLLSTIRDLFGPSDVVHFHSTPSAAFALLARLRGRKVVVTVHSREWQRRKWFILARWFLHLSEWAAVRLPHRTVVVGLELKRALDERYGTDVIYIPNGVEARTRRAPDQIRRYGITFRDYLLYLGRLVPEKQCHVLIDAFRSMDRR